MPKASLLSAPWEAPQAMRGAEPQGERRGQGSSLVSQGDGEGLPREQALPLLDPQSFFIPSKLLITASRDFSMPLCAANGETKGLLGDIPAAPSFTRFVFKPWTLLQSSPPLRNIKLCTVSGPEKYSFSLFCRKCPGKSGWTVASVRNSLAGGTAFKDLASTAFTLLWISCDELGP